MDKDHPVEEEWEFSEQLAEIVVTVASIATRLPVYFLSSKLGTVRAR